MLRKFLVISLLFFSTFSLLSLSACGQPCDKAASGGPLCMSKEAKKQAEAIFEEQERREKEEQEKKKKEQEDKDKNNRSEDSSQNSELHI